MKKIIIVGMSLILAFSLIACSNNNGIDEKNIEKQSSDIQTLQEPMVQIANPRVEYKTVTEAKEVLGFDYNELAYIPEDFKLSNVYIIDNNVIEINYSNGDNEISYRAGQVDFDISGDYNDYSQEKVIKISDNDVTIKGKDDKIYVAIWKTEDVSHSMTITNGLNENDLITILK